MRGDSGPLIGDSRGTPTASVFKKLVGFATKSSSGKVVKGADGQPISIVGPENTVSEKMQKRYKVVQFLCDVITRHELGKPLSHPQ